MSIPIHFSNMEFVGPDGEKVDLIELRNKVALLEAIILKYNMHTPDCSHWEAIDKQRKIIETTPFDLNEYKRLDKQCNCPVSAKVADNATSI